ncbi:hypothetical protein KHC28_21315 [Ancylobacter sonchi]|uniref:hypothetical protein n=1 Tax=Ancylobacter sonchi TaxID=1937790 RepID=UPI001BD2A935|nr:hypothetical protein [Ancylobacter sonchi]MBS7536195.1 hypothetical protein [Ancylobacter sonchi]
MLAEFAEAALPLAAKMIAAVSVAPAIRPIPQAVNTSVLLLLHPRDSDAKGVRHEDSYFVSGM